MPTQPDITTAYRRRPAQESNHQTVAHHALTPAERIALTIARLNSGLDKMDEMARTSLARCVRGVIRGRDDRERDDSAGASNRNPERPMHAAQDRGGGSTAYRE